VRLARKCAAQVREAGPYAGINGRSSNSTFTVGAPGRASTVSLVIHRCLPVANHYVVPRMMEKAEPYFHLVLLALTVATIVYVTVFGAP
jgi:hypothetical protein